MKSIFGKYLRGFLSSALGHVHDKFRIGEHIPLSVRECKYIDKQINLSIIVNLYSILLTFIQQCFACFERFI